MDCSGSVGRKNAQVLKRFYFNTLEVSEVCEFARDDMPGFYLKNSVNFELANGGSGLQET